MTEPVVSFVVAGQDPPLPAFAAPGRAAPSLRGKVDWQDATVVSVRAEGARAVTVRLALPVWNAHVPGQHYMLRLTAADGYTAQRHYSVASPPDDAGHIEFTVDRVEGGGEVSGHLHDVARPGDTMAVRGPLGGFFAWPGDRPVLLIGGGSGMVPLMAMIRHRRRRALAVPMRVVACARTPEDLVYAEELAPLPGERHTILYSRSAPEGYPHPVGRLTAASLAADAAEALAGDYEVFVCGSTGFAEHAGRLLTAAGVPTSRIRVERFG